ncbi:tetratricopeptide repeat-containing glycosyltransferase family protein [Bradyrhizobium sp. B097]|uniref:tetratricopeptide repeat-containing glycosyltransferase family protein n=1 Tax=Bradyrhizobium sp. B097 TaxID=3140244 RepID=UPI003182F3EA
MNTAEGVTVHPNDSQWAFAEASTLHDASRFAEAEIVLRDAITRDPSNVRLRNARGVTFAAMNRYLDAVCCYREALAYDGSITGIWTNLGNALARLNHLNSAIYCHRRAIALSQGRDPLLYHNLGTSFAEAGEHSEAVISFSNALKLNEAYHSARWDRGLSYLHLGNYAQGWPDYEIRKVTGQLPARKLPGSEWDGKPYGGKRLILICEQGFGDMLWVARYLAQVKALGGELVIECRPELISLIAHLGVADRIIPRGSSLPQTDLHCYICSLPGFFTKDVASIPNRTYLAAPFDRRDRFKALIPATAGLLKVGIVWSGSVTFGNNRRRAQPLLSFFQACALPGVQLYSLQKGEPSAELHSLPQGWPIIDLSPHLNDFADTAAAIEQLDLVVMTDSAVAHLAGALGKPVWVLLGRNAHWLWLTHRTDSPWYPSMRLFRPRAGGDWDHVFDKVSAELMSLARL